MESTRERLVSAARRLFADQGYQATSTVDVLKLAGANPGSLYHAFPAKQDLLVAVLKDYAARIETTLLEPAWRGVEDPIERVFALLGAYRRMLAQSNCLFGCPIGSLALELHDPDPQVRALLAANFDGWIDHVQACFEAAGDRLPAGVDTRRLAVFVLTTMEGGVMLARTRRELEPFDTAVEALRDYLARLEQSARGG